MRCKGKCIKSHLTGRDRYLVRDAPLNVAFVIHIRSKANSPSFSKYLTLKQTRAGPCHSGSSAFYLKYFENPGEHVSDRYVEYKPKSRGYFFSGETADPCWWFSQNLYNTAFRKLPWVSHWILGFSDILGAMLAPSILNLPLQTNRWISKPKFSGTTQLPLSCEI